MLDRPDAPTLLRAMASTLTDEVLPKTTGGTQHAVRVVANLCRILEREFQAGPASAEKTRESLSQLLDQDADLPLLIARLDRELSERPLGRPEDANDFDARALNVILADVERRLEIDRPGYSS
jgi:hypothetical protein